MTHRKSDCMEHSIVDGMHASLTNAGDIMEPSHFPLFPQLLMFRFSPFLASHFFLTTGSFSRINQAECIFFVIVYVTIKVFPLFFSLVDDTFYYNNIFINVVKYTLEYPSNAYPEQYMFFPLFSKGKQTF